MKSLVSILALVALLLPSAVFACTQCKDCRADHENVCADECKADAFAGKNGKGEKKCQKSCMKEKCGCTCDCHKAEKKDVSGKEGEVSAECLEQCSAKKAG